MGRPIRRLRCAWLHDHLAGECWITLEGKDPVKLERGDFFLLPSTPPFSLSSHPGIDCEPRDPMNVAVRHGEQDGDLTSSRSAGHSASSR